jgi:pectate lyase
MKKVYEEKIKRAEFGSIHCPANKYNFLQIAYTGETYPCSLYRMYGERNCFECSTKNQEVLKSIQVFNVAEAESDVSEAGMRLYYDGKKIRH